MPLKNGIYVITNVKQRNSVFLENPDDETPLRAHYRHDSPGERWQVIDRGNGQHSIQNVGFQRYANSGTLSGLDAFVEGRDREQLWYIQERSKGQYTIATTDSGNFWMLPDNQINTPVGLLDKPTDQRCWWIFTNPETKIPVDDSVTREAILFELKLLPIAPFSPLRLDFVVLQPASDDSLLSASRTIDEICGSLVSSKGLHPDILRANVIEFKPFESSTIFFRRFTGFVTVETLCNVGNPGISWKKCSGASLPEMAIRDLRADATKVAVLNLDVTILQHSSQAIVELINGLVKLNITLILAPILPPFYNSDVFRELRNLSSESRLFEQMDEFSDYVVNYNETVALPRLIEYPEFREVIHQSMPHIIELLKDKDHDARSLAVTALSRFAEHANLHDIIRQEMAHIMGVLKDKDHDARSAAVAALWKLAEQKGLCEDEAISRDSFGRTALSWAAGKGYGEAVRLMLGLEGDIDITDNLGRTPFFQAAMQGHEVVARLLLAHKGVNINVRDILGGTPLSWAADRGHEAIICLLLEQETINVNAKSGYGDTPLSLAVWRGNYGVVRLMLAHKGVDVNAKSNNGMAPLLWAAMKGHDEVIRLLLAHKGVNVNTKDNTGRAPLSRAAVNGHKAVVSLLLEKEGVDVKAKDNSGNTPLVETAYEGHDAVVRLLLAHKGIDVNAKSNNGMTPLSWAAMKGHDKMVRLLLAHKDIDVNDKGYNGRTALAWAAEGEHHEVVQLLQSRGGQRTASSMWSKLRR